MKRMTVKEILNCPEFAQYISPNNIHFFVTKKSDVEEIANVSNISMADISMDDSIFEQMQQGKSSDAVMTSIITHGINDSLKKYASKLSSDKLALLLGYQSLQMWTALNSCFLGKGISGHEELFFENGDYVVVDGKNIEGQINGKPLNTETQIMAMQDKLARGIIRANAQFDQKSKKSIELKGTYTRSGMSQEPVILRVSSKNLYGISMHWSLYTTLNYESLREFIKDGTISRNDLLTAFRKADPSYKGILIMLMNEGILTENEIIRKLYNKKSFDEIASDDETPYNVVELLYQGGKIPLKTLEKVSTLGNLVTGHAKNILDIKDIEECAKKFQGKEQDLSTEMKNILSVYREMPKEETINKLGELLTHNVLNYATSMNLLKKLESEKIISSEDKSYIEGIMSDFKTNELLNDTENKVLDVKESGERRQSYVSGLTIDPEVRMEYFKSLGAVKKVKIKGESFIADSEENRGKRNSMDGYELFILPAKKIAILEKLYETTRDKDGNIVYKRNDKGELIPAVENATYMMPIELAKEFAETKNKRELIQSPYVERTYHSSAWVENTERKMMKLRPEIQFDEKETKKWADLVRENYRKNKNAMTL